MERWHDDPYQKNVHFSKLKFFPSRLSMIFSNVNFLAVQIKYGNSKHSYNHLYYLMYLEHKRFPPYQPD